MLALWCLLMTAIAGTVTVDVLDVGQGDAILIRSPEGKSVLIDAGTGKVDVVPMLKARGLTELNMVIGTHAHADHIGGMDEVLDAIPIKVYLDNGMPHTTRTYEKVMALVEAKEIRYIEGKRDQEFNLGSEVKLQVLHPQNVLLRNTRSDLNSNSVVIRMTHGNNCFLFTGDAEEPTEHQLVQQGVGTCDVLKVAHHGSNHSSTNHFLQTVQPKIAVISLGEDNRYGHPGEEAMARIEKTGAEIYRTDTMGTVTIQSDGKNITVQTKKEAVVHKVDHGTVKEIAKVTTDTTVISDVGGKFDINTATQSQIESINGIGPSKAAAIIAYRTEHGPFTNINELDKVSGIGPKTVEKIALKAYVLAQ